ncbi:SDR family oxidoreductase [Kribbella jejuensis]|uniref:NADP-dependent 3-hydroxy acid dehydrogenase YdfG n=1 Tax=Kribbella jejuensis TaxID=236068 RepID=A0A542EA30_9ACTN|nr:SDR family oxidoreductase [Kribbella jejuensis]TQJ12184.1 NADP-dependent 3-hydroxy acid dehydrogenase YdfG [Kribbella jejuensis]
MSLQRVAVTGGSSGLGAAVVRAVQKNGGTAVALDRQRPADDSVPWVEVDLADPHAAEPAVARAEDLIGPLTGVVTAAGIDSCGKLEEVPLDDWVRVVTVDLIGTAAVARAAVPRLEPTHGRLVTIASTLGLRALSDATAYCASKFGVVGFTRALAVETAGRIGVTMIVPGGMRTSFFDGRPDQYKPGADAMLNDPEVVADTIVFALSQPTNVEIRELVICPSVEPSWP